MCCSSEKSLDEKNKTKRIGIDELRWSILTACGLEKSFDLKRVADVKILEAEDVVDKEEKQQFTPM